MSIEENKRVTRSFIDDAWNSGRYDEARDPAFAPVSRSRPMGPST